MHGKRQRIPVVQEKRVEVVIDYQVDYGSGIVQEVSMSWLW